MKKIKLIIASSNEGKIGEFQKILPDFECIPQSDFNVSDVDETGKNFKENAVLKAKNAFIKTNLPSIGDDSGLIVPEINGEPGLYSARYAGKNATDVDNRKKLISELKKMKNKSTNPAQRKTTLKWNTNGELSSIDMARIINALSDTELKECELTCNRVRKNERTLKLGMWW